jgi:hypothetical protein
MKPALCPLKSLFGSGSSVLQFAQKPLSSQPQEEEEEEEDDEKKKKMGGQWRKTPRWVAEGSFPPRGHGKRKNCLRDPSPPQS